MKSSTVPTDGNELKGTIKMGDNEEHPYSEREPAQPPPQQQRRLVVPPEFRNLNTLDEPVCETIVTSFHMSPISITEERLGQDLVQTKSGHQPNYTPAITGQAKGDQEL
jgi:hypothetical protein